NLLDLGSVPTLLTWGFVSWRLVVCVYGSGEGELGVGVEQLECSLLYRGGGGEFLEALTVEVDCVAGELAEVREEPGKVVYGQVVGGCFRGVFAGGFG
ncbi:MAG: hypothetical protein ACRD0P_17300, partial [Stackebrandtia sp.]